MHKLACPKCHESIVQEGNSYKCANNHCYDLAKTKYLNLLLNPDKATNNPGDSKESLVARKAYLTKGYYDVILKSVIDCIKKYRDDTPLDILDLGCGEGYYTRGLKEIFSLDTIIYICQFALIFFIMFNLFFYMTNKTFSRCSIFFYHCNLISIM